MSTGPWKRKIKEKLDCLEFVRWRQTFLDTLRLSANVYLSCRTAGVTRGIAYIMRDKYPDFRQEWETAIDDAVDTLEAVALKRAKASSDLLLIFLLKAHRPEKYREVYKVEHTIIQAEIKKVAQEQGLQEAEVMAEFERIMGQKVG